VVGCGVVNKQLAKIYFAASCLATSAGCGDDIGHAEDSADETGDLEPDTGQYGESGDGVSDDDDTDTDGGKEDVPDDSCEEADACGDECCGDGELCLASACVLPGDPCWNHDDCADGEYCEFEAGEGEAPPDGCHAPPADEGACLPRPDLCEGGETPEDGCVVACMAQPHLDAAPLETFTWDSFDVMNTPLVVQLDDDNCDGAVDARDIPDIVFPAFDGVEHWNNGGFLVAVSIIDGELVEKWITVLDEDHLRPSFPLAAGDIDGEPGAEIVACTETEKVRVFASDGTELWTSELESVCGVPNIADLDQDGSPEIITRNFAWDGVTGDIVATFGGAEAEKGYVAPVDLDGDGFLEVVAAGRVYAGDGTELLDTGIFGQRVGVADFDLDGRPEIVAVASDYLTDSHHLHLWRYDENHGDGFEIIREDIDLHMGYDPSQCSIPEGGAGSPIIADLNMDGSPDVVVGTRVSFVALDGKLLLDSNVSSEDTALWARPQNDCTSGGVGGGIFDLDGDGVPELAHADQLTFGVYDAATGAPSFQTCNTNGTTSEFPLVVDADGDGAAEILVAANNFYWPLKCNDDSTRRGLRIFEASEGHWMPSSTMWNEYNFHQTNVEKDGAIPVAEATHWKDPEINSFRRPLQLSTEFLAPDLVPFAVSSDCEGTYTLFASVLNQGQAAAPANLEVAFYAGDPDEGGQWLGTVPIGAPLLPGDTVEIPLQLPNPPQDLLNGESDAFVVVDPDEDHLWRECARDNNVSSAPAICD
jgi:hypothetical protein